MLWEVQKPAMSTGQTRTYSFWQKDKTAWCLPARFLWQRVSLLSWLYQLPTTQPLFSLKTLSISRQPWLWLAYCYRRTFPPSISRMTVFNAIWKILSERLDDGSCFLFSGLLWGGWLVSTLLVFVLITSSCISRNRCVMRDTKAYHEHWADADISFLAKGQDRLMSAYTLCSMAQFYLALFLVSSPDHPPLLMGSSTMLVLLRRLSASHYPDGYGRLSPVQI